MSVSADDGSEDVNDFLLRIKELGDRRDQEDEERNRKLEEEILQGRKERQARRAERARSISPTKSSPSNTPNTSKIPALQASPLSHAASHKQTDLQQEDFEARRDMAVGDAMDRLAGTSNLSTKENHAPIDIEKDIAGLKRVSSIKASPSSAMASSKNSPLSWQRRPTSQQSSDRPRSRPLSMIATENAARSPRATPEPATTFATEPTLSRDQIAQALASKDPAWFRQTPDRGLNSPAYRRNQVEDESRSDHGSESARVQMPGMARASPKSDEVKEVIDRTSSPSRGSSVSGSASKASYQSLPAISGGVRSPVPISSAQRFDPPSLDSEVRMSPSQGRISPDRLDRPASPTKGMGGFVQSAMMKRSDSVSKRWSVQSPPGLTRGNSIASNRSSQEPISGLSSSNIMSPSTEASGPSTLSRDNTPLPLSRPTSSHSTATVTPDGRPGTSSSVLKSTTTSTIVGFVKPALPQPRSHTPKSQENAAVLSPQRIVTTPPTSPSKTLDTRRWSPTKSSWLESALNKPESPKPKAMAPPPQQPTWMSEINKAKQRTSVDLGRNPPTGPKHAVSVGGFMRSPPPGGFAKPLTVGGLPSGFSSGMTPEPRKKSVNSQETKISPTRAESSDTTVPPPTALNSSPITGKVKPETPPKKDFRTSLKSRPLPADDVGKSEPEFKNVFGQLRRTQTQHYIAPDELKDNITRGKMGLNVTGGPKKTERKDEFKDAILKKKEDFKKTQSDGKGVTRSTSGSSQDVALPEALAKRNTLGRPDPTMSESPLTLDSPSRQRTVRESPTPKLHSELSAPGRMQGKETAGNKLAGRLNPALAGLLARGPPSAASETSRSSSPANSQRTVSISTSTTIADTSEAGPQLTHMTKARARGPRRKAPSSAPTSVTSEEKPPTIATSTSTVTDVDSLIKRSDEIASQDPDCSNKSESLPQAMVGDPQSQASSPQKLDLKRRSQFLQEAPNKSNRGEPQPASLQPLLPTKKANATEVPMNFETPKSEKSKTPITKPKPDTPIKSPSLSSRIAEQLPAEKVESPETAKLRPLALSPRKILVAESLSKSPLAEPKTPTPSIVPAELPSDVKSVSNAAVLWDRPSASKYSSDPPRVRSPIRLPTQADEKAAMVGAGLRSLSPTKDGVPSSVGIQRPASRPLPTPPTKVPDNGPVDLNDYASRLPSRTSTPRSKSSPKLNKPSSPQTETSRVLSDFFGTRSTPLAFTIDAAALLSQRQQQSQDIQTLRASLYQLSGDGKKQLVPSHQERLLFEGNMYLCVHTYGSAGKKIIETNWWIGDEVPQSTVEGAEIFARREAKSNKLVKIRQGKETPEFIQALGGIVIVRRGSSNKYDSLAPHILCGRKYFGAIAFDEVDYAPTSLCSGFPYLISSQSGKCYLWKGKGSGVDELSCARLIGMDFGLTGEIEEVEDGSEPDSFLQVFGNGAKITPSAQHWRLKPSYDKYCARLFCSDSTANSQIVEISPFSQEDLSPSKIFVLDAFFEIYVIVGSQAQSQYPAFHNALMFAQEYGILAASIEDRPMVPFSSVVLEGTPKDMKSVFRKWREGLASTVSQSGSLQRGRSLRVVPLNAALEATR